jgi:hypothetical protein
MNRRSFLASGFGTSAALQGFQASAANGAEFYVVPGGLDGNPGNQSKLFATLQRARNEVRQLNANGLRTNVIVWIHGGTYTLQDTLIFSRRIPTRISTRSLTRRFRASTPSLLPA